MGKFNLGQEIFWIKYNGNMPFLRSFKVESIKQTKDGFKYGLGIAGSSWVEEDMCFGSAADAVEDACRVLKELLQK